MAYLRQRGNQLAIVRGVRDGATGKVEQQILLTIYSQDEAREAIGPGARWLQGLLKDRFPGVAIGWKKIAKGIEEKIAILPERYEKRTERLLGRFREGLSTFTRQLALADPQRLASAAELIREQEHELTFLRDLIDWRLANRDAKPAALTRDPFFWEHALEAPGIPTDVEELVDGIVTVESREVRDEDDGLLVRDGADDYLKSLGPPVVTEYAAEGPFFQALAHRATPPRASKWSPTARPEPSWRRSSGRQRKSGRRVP